MGGGLMQLVAYGAQDIYLTGNPQITFFKVVYRRHTNFSIEAIEQTMNGNAQLGGSSSVTISRNGDLVYRMYLGLEWNRRDFSNGSSGVLAANIGSAVIDQVELEIGGQRIDRHSGHWMETYVELTNDHHHFNQVSVDATNAYGGGNLLQRSAGINGAAGPSAGADLRGNSIANLLVPLQFWFCRNVGLALPLIALQYHEVKVNFDFASQSSVSTLGVTGVSPNPSPFSNITLWCDYIYLDTDERRRFAQVSHEYLIEQVQTDTLRSTTGSNRLNFNHPVKELIISGAPAASLGSDTGPSTPTELATQAQLILKLNGHDRFSVRDMTYFTRTQLLEYHNTHGGRRVGGANFHDSIGVYSFALKPEEHQPSGSCNFSRIDNAELVVQGSTAINTGTNGPPLIYAVNYNVLRIMSGMGGLAYSN